MLKKSCQLLFKLNNSTQIRNKGHVAFIGIGNMGSRMATNLLSKGETLHIYDSDRPKSETVKGAKICSTAAEAAEDASVVITMLPNGDVVRDTLFETGGVLKSAPNDTLFIDCSTIQPNQAQQLSKDVHKAGKRFIDAPVSGGVTGAAASTLTFMIGGPETIVKQVEPLLLKMGSKVYHCGGPGAGQIAKLCNNLILGVTMIGTAEALNLGTKLGLDPKLLTSIVNVSTGRSWSSETYNPVPGINEGVPSNKGYEGGFAVGLIAKDLGLAEGAAVTANAPVPLTAAAHQIYRTLAANGHGDKDFSYVYQLFKGLEAK